MALFLTFNFEADDVEDALSQVLSSAAIPKNVQKISAYIIENFPEQRNNQNEIRWETNGGDVLECYYGEYGWEFSLDSRQLPRNLLMVCMGRIDYSNAIPPQQFNGSPLEKIFQYEQMIKGKYTERGALFDADGNIVTYASGNSNSVDLPSLEDNVVYATHSHPDIASFDMDAQLRKIHFGTPFSPADFNLFLKHRNIKQLRVVFSNGVVMVCEKTKPKLTNADINRAMEILSRNVNRDMDKIYNDYVLSKGDDPRDSRADMNRKLVKFGYELEKSTAANLGLHIYFYLKDGRLVEHLKGKKITTPKKKHVVKKPTVKSPVKKAPVRKRVVRRSPAIRIDIRRMF